MRQFNCGGKNKKMNVGKYGNKRTNVPLNNWEAPAKRCGSATRIRLARRFRAGMPPTPRQRNLDADQVPYLNWVAARTSQEAEHVRRNSESRGAF